MSADAPATPAASVQEGVIDGTRVRWWTTGPEHTPVIVMLHGFRGSHRGLLPLATLLPNYRIVLPDLPGWGESDSFSTIHNFPAYMRWIHAFLQTIGAPVHLAGHSFGASLALMYASEYPADLQQLFLIEPVVNSPSFTRWLGESYYKVGEKLPTSWRDPWLKSPILNRLTTEIMTVTKDPSVKKWIVADEQENLRFIKTDVEIEANKSYYDVDFMTAAPKITTPTVLIGGTRDQMTAPQVTHDIAAMIPNCQLHMIPSAGHFAPMEIPASIAEIITQTFRID